MWYLILKEMNYNNKIIEWKNSLWMNNKLFIKNK